MNKTLLTISQVFVAIGAVVIGIYALIFIFVIGLVCMFIRIGQAKDNPYMKTEIIVYSVILLITSNIYLVVYLH